jgi:hypothetical protein
MQGLFGQHALPRPAGLKPAVKPGRHAKQRAQVDVPERRHEYVADGVAGAAGVRDGGVDVLDAVAEVEGFVLPARANSVSVMPNRFVTSAQVLTLPILVAPAPL